MDETAVDERTSPGARRGNIPARSCAICLAAIMLLSVLAVWHRQQARRARWERNRAQLAALTETGNAIVRQLEQYRREHGRYPSRPEMQPRLPPPPAVAKSEWQYTVTSPDGPCQLALYLAGSMYPWGWQFHTALVYHSDGRYGREGYGGVLVDRLGAWAFYVE